MSKKKDETPSKKTTARSSKPGTADWLFQTLPKSEEQSNTTQVNSEDPSKTPDMKCTGTTDTNTESS